MIDYDHNFWNAEAVTRVTTSPDLDRTVANVGALVLFEWLRDSAVTSAVDSSHKTSFDAIVRRAISDASKVTNSLDPRLVFHSLERRFEEWTLGVPNSAQAMPTNPYIATACTTRARELMKSSNLEATAANNDFESRVTVNERQLPPIVPSQESEILQTALRMAVWSLGGAGIAFTAVWSVFQLPRMICVAIAVAAGVATALVGRTSIKRAPNREEVGRSAGQGAIRSAVRSLERHFIAKALAHTAEQQVSAGIDESKIGSVLEIIKNTLKSTEGDTIIFAHAARIEIGGRRIAENVFAAVLDRIGPDILFNRVLQRLANKGTNLTELIANLDAVLAVAALRDALTAEIGTTTLERAITSLINEPGGQHRLKLVIEHLAKIATSVVSIHGGFVVDGSLCPESLEIGLPLGDRDPLAAVLSGFLPHAQVFQSFDEGSIEIVYDIRNLSAADLVSYGQSARAYHGASDLERKQLFHFPRRYTAVSEIGSTRVVAK